MRSAAVLAACEGSILVVDASQGVEAQTLANVYSAIDNNHEIVPVLNKIDLPAAEPERVRAQIEDLIGLDASDAVLASAKSGLGIHEVLEAIVTRLPAPKGDENAPLKALLVDAWYDAYLGVVVLVRVFDGRLKAGQKMQDDAAPAPPTCIDKVGVFKPKTTPVETRWAPARSASSPPQIKEVADAAVGDTTHRREEADGPGPAGLQGSPAGGLLRPVPGRRRRLRGPARRRRQAAPQRRQLHLRDGKLAPRWASASAAGSWACCTWRSSRSA